MNPILRSILALPLVLSFLGMTGSLAEETHSSHHGQHPSHHSPTVASPPRSSFDPQAICAARFQHVLAEPLCVQAQWTQVPKSPGVPPEGRTGQIELKFTKGGQPFPLSQLPALPRVWLVMPEMDHGSMPVTISPPSTDGDRAHILIAKDLVFSMKGFWEIRLSMPRKKAPKKTEQVALPYQAD